MKPDLSKKTPVSELPAQIRNTHFEEVVLGYTLDEAILESQRCLECKQQFCVKGCPVGVNIPGFIHHIKRGDIEKAYEVLSGDNALPAVCGRVCPQENQCEGMCIRAKKGESVAIGRLEGFVADYIEKNKDYKSEKIQLPKPIDMKVAVIGSGPAGLSCAMTLAKAGAKVTIFEALHKIGGVLTYGIPEFRLPKAIVKREQEKLEAYGVDIQTNTLIGKSYTLEQLKEQGYNRFFIGSGAGLPKFLGIEGENLMGVYSANEYLTRVNLMGAFKENAVTPIQKGKRVAVIGGGNVAMDAARTAKRLGAEEVMIVYRRSKEDLPARLEEIHHAEEEGILFKTLYGPEAILGEHHKVVGLNCQLMILTEKDASGRQRPEPIEGAFETLECDTVIIAIGQSPNPLIPMTMPEITTNAHGCIQANEETMETSVQHVFAGGDAVTGAATVIKAMGAGKQAAETMLYAYANEKFKTMN